MKEGKKERKRLEWSEGNKRKKEKESRKEESS